jgi:FkbM family methyltransferase
MLPMIRKQFLLLSYHWHNATLVFRNYRGLSDRLLVLWTYARINLRYLIWTRLMKRRIEQETFLGFHVSVVDYLSFRDLFTELFVMREYEFKGDDEPHIIDCGSNIGMSVLFFKKAFPRCEVLCFEPNPAAFECLQRNVAANNLDRVVLVEAAVGIEAGSATLYTAPSHEGSDLEASIVATMQPGRSLIERTVRRVRVSEYVDRHVDLMKLDVQGGEGAVVEDLAASGKLGHVQRLIIEYHDDLTDAQNRLGDLLRRLEAAGFLLVIHSAHEPPFTRHVGKPTLLQIYAYRK